MHIETLPLEATVGHILCHNLADEQGRKAFAKGHRVREGDLSLLRELGQHSLRVAVLAAGDVHEDRAAQRLGAAVAGPGVEASVAHAGRVNLRSRAAGPLVVATEALLAINALDGLTVATLAAHTLVRPSRTLATIKVIPFAVPGDDLDRAETIGQLVGGVLSVRPLCLNAVGVVLVSSVAARTRVERGVYPAIADRVTDLGGEVLACHSVTPDEHAVAGAIGVLRMQGAELLIVAGETSVVDIDDVTPRGILLAGGRIEHYGAPVEPGNLLLLGYLEGASGMTLPVLGAPGCVRSRDVNIVDLLLPRLMAGEQVRRSDIIALGHGGLLG